VTEAPPDFTHAYARLLPPIRAKTRRMLGRSPAAQDVAQEAFFRLWKSGIARGADTRTVMAWLYRTCTHLAIDVLRARRRSDFAEGVDEDTPCGVDLAASTEAKAAILSLARAVPEEQLAAAILCRVDGLAQPEAAAVLGVSERTVRRLLAQFDQQIDSLRREFSP
jgi:RNA polymerase sigma factor (sigma-70 family)